LRWPDNYFRVVASYGLQRTRFHDYDDVFEELNSTSTTYNYKWNEINDSNQVVTRTRQVKQIGEALPGSIVAYNEDWNTASKLALTVVRDSRDLPEFATRGSIMSYSYQLSGGPLGGFWDYQSHQIKLAKFIPLFWRFALATRLEYAVILEASDDPTDQRILLSDRFTPGGTAYDGTVRGYDDGTLTPDSLVYGSDTAVWYYADPDTIDPQVDPPDSMVISPSFKTRVRGKYMLIANAEIHLPIVENSIYGLLFLDAGRSWLHLDDIKPVTGLYKGFGLGFRIMVPGIGTIGFDFARPLDDPPDGSDRGWKPHFQIGTTIR
jgi:outer membrane protein insertion porin family